MTRVILAGAAGRMGQRINTMIQAADGVELAAAFEHGSSPAVGRDAGEVAGVGTLGIPIAPGLEEVIDLGDVIIDFTFHEATMGFARLAAEHNRAMVIGTTGLSRDNLLELETLTLSFPCVQSYNMAVGVNVLFKMAAKLAGLLGRGKGYDMEIVEAHHRLKKDAPSGTAIRLGELMAHASDRNLDQDAVFARHGIIGARTDREIGIQTIRGGDIIGEHTVYFAGQGERIELTHRAHSRDNFAKGAVLAAKWTTGRANGLYTMFDVLDLNDF